MSLLDDVSIVVTPNGYKAGRLYGVLPTATEGSELVQDSNFSLTGTQAQSTNGTYWDTGAGWTIANNKATSNGTVDNLDGITLEIDKNYKATVTVSGMTTGNLSYRLGGSSSNEILSISSNGEYTAYGVAGGTVLRLRSQNGFNGSVTNISVKEWTASDMDVTRATAATRVDENGLVNYAEILGSELVTSWTNKDFTSFTSSGSDITQMVSSGSGNNCYSLATFTSGKTYKLKFTCSQNITAQIRLSPNTNLTSGVVVYSNPTSGSNEIYFTPSSNYSYVGVYAASSFTDTQISDFTLKEVTRNNVPRIDYTGGGCPHILSEPQSTNLETKSNEFSTWSLTSNVTPTANYIVSPDGTQNATRLQFTGNGFRANTTSTTSALRTLSCYAKRNDSGTQSVGFFVNGSGTVDSAWSLTSDWKRFTHTYTTSNSSYIGIAGLSGADVSVFGFQIEQQSYPTSYIPTSGSTVTRNTDQFSRDGIASLINSTAGVFFIEMATFLDEGTTADKWIALSDGTANNSVRIAYSGGANTIRAYLNVGGSAQADMTYAVTDVTQFSKIAFSYAANNFNLWVDGVKRATDTSGNVFSANTLNRLGLDNGGGGSCPVKIKQIQVYDTALTDTQLAALTS